MKKYNYHKNFVRVLLILFIGCAVSLWAQAEFKGRLITGVGPASNVRIKIESFSTPDEIRQLRQAFAVGAEEGFFAAFRQLNKASLRFFGGRGLNISLHAAYEIPTDNGYKIFLYGKSQRVEPGSSQMDRQGFFFLVVVLDLDKNYEGEGKIYETARIRFTDQGVMEMESSITAPKTLVSISLVK
jgi:hypothetical protein